MKLTPEEILEGNHVIAKFMETLGKVDYLEGKGMEDCYWAGATCTNNYSLSPHRIGDLKYHCSWEWTMPVVDKINAMGKAFSLAIFKNYISLTVEKSGNKFYKDFSFSHSEYITAEQTGKEAMFKLLVKFIKWHNQQVASTNLEITK